MSVSLASGFGHAGHLDCPLSHQQVQCQLTLAAELGLVLLTFAPLFVSPAWLGGLPGASPETVRPGVRRDASRGRARVREVHEMAAYVGRVTRMVDPGTTTATGCPMLEGTPNRSVQVAPPNLGELLEDALLQARNLVQAEVSLARTELKGELKVAATAVLLLVAGGMFLQAALVVLGVLLVVAWGGGAASTAVVIALAVIGVGLTFVAVKSLQRERLPRTTARLSSDAKQVLESVK